MLAPWATYAAVASATITLSADFDSASLDVAHSSAAGELVTLAGRDNFNPGDWKWLYFQADGVTGQTPTFRIGDNFETGGSSLTGHAMVYSYDQQTWAFFDSNVRSAAQNTFTFKNNSPFAEDRVFVAYGLPYSYGRVVEHTQELIGNPWASATISGNSSLVVGPSPGGVDDLGRTIAPRDMFGYKITDTTQPASSKKKVVLFSGVHANETLGNLTLEGLVDFLVSDDPEAARLRRLAEFYVYPMVNPDGRFAGYNRSTVQAPATDPNRVWDPPGYGGLDDVRVAGEVSRADTGGDVDYVIDFHSTVNGKEGHYGYVLPAYQDDPLWQDFLQLEPEVRTLSASLIDDTAAKFGRDILGAEFSITFETQFLAGENIDRFLDLGRHFGLAFERTLRVAGDLNFDGALDGSDWTLFLAGADADLSHMSAADAYAAGDLNGDGRNDLADFGEFKDAYIAAHGPGAFAVLLGGVPEPSCATLVSAGLFVHLGAASRRRRCQLIRRLHHD
ncbi:MAG: succinylglutamate desuccinylase/aspartoacylase family protein [Planctomycetales bacterium]|nr:succinylglutamate desuccinylase/aspartoacylase family protein [Planctomycetales bacterium]